MFEIEQDLCVLFSHKFRGQAFWSCVKSPERSLQPGSRNHQQLSCRGRTQEIPRYFLNHCMFLVGEKSRHGSKGERCSERMQACTPTCTRVARRLGRCEGVLCEKEKRKRGKPLSVVKRVIWRRVSTGNNWIEHVLPLVLSADAPHLWFLQFIIISCLWLRCNTMNRCLHQAVRQHPLNPASWWHSEPRPHTKALPTAFNVSKTGITCAILSRRNDIVLEAHTLVTTVRYTCPRDECRCTRPFWHPITYDSSRKTSMGRLTVHRMKECTVLLILSMLSG